MDRRQFMITSSSTLAFASLSNQILGNQVGQSIKVQLNQSGKIDLKEDHAKILYYASLAPSSHNTQPWTVAISSDAHWTIGIDQDRCLPEVDPKRREMYLSLGTFLENLILAAGNFGYKVEYQIQHSDREVIDLRLVKSNEEQYPLTRLKNRRTIKNNHQQHPLKPEDLEFLLDNVKMTTYFPSHSNIADEINRLTVEGNEIQVNRDLAQAELAEWIRFSKSEAKNKRDGLTPSSMEITGLAKFFVQTFYNKSTVMQDSFRKQTVDTAKKQTEKHGGWLVFLSINADPAALIEAGRRFQQVALKATERSIALHPMSQAIEEIPEQLPKVLKIGFPVQFLVRTSYVSDYPAPVSLRRPIESFVS